MCPNHHHSRVNLNFTSLNKQQGISMAFLLFAIVIISLLAAAIIQVNSSSNISNVHQVISTRAFNAAESGAQLQALAIFPVDNVTPSSCTNTTYNFTATGMSGCTATVTCSQNTFDGINYYRIISQGQCNAGQDLQATRTIETRLKSPN
jgi:MSHA biogenesis protein MshP